MSLKKMIIFLCFGLLRGACEEVVNLSDEIEKIVLDEARSRVVLRQEERKGFSALKTFDKEIHIKEICRRREQQQLWIDRKIAEMYVGALHQSWPDEPCVHDDL